MELIRPIVKVGNSAGVILPRDWLNGKAKITLVEEPANINKEVFDILGKHLNSVLGIYITGSYARNEKTKDSDIDILVITTNIDSRLVDGRYPKYDLLLVSEDSLKDSLKNNALPLIPMLREAKPILNGELINKYKEVKLSKENLKWHIDTTNSALKVIRASLDLAKETKEKISANIVYSLVLRLREVLIVNALLRDKSATTKELLNTLKRITGSTEIYKIYKISKDNPKAKKTISLYDAKEVYKFLKNEFEGQEEWIKRKL